MKTEYPLNQVRNLQGDDMRLRVFWPPEKPRHVPDHSVFYIQPAHGEGHRSAVRKEIVALERLRPRIHAMATNLFSSEFIAITANKNKGRLELVMKKGVIHRGMKKDFDSFRGWIELCSME